MYSIQNNSPAAGYIQWSNVNIQYNGVSYPIQDGYTNYIYVYWLASNPGAFVVSDTFPTLTPSDVLVFLNKSGIAMVVPTATILDGGLIVPGSIYANAIAANTITGNEIAAGAISADEIAANAVTADKVAANAIGAGAIAAGVIVADHIASGAITSDKIVSGAVTTDKLAARSVTANEMAVGTITAGSGIIADAAITNAKIVDLNAGKVTAGTLISVDGKTYFNLDTAEIRQAATVGGEALSIRLNPTEGLAFYQGTVKRGGMAMVGDKLALTTDIIKDPDVEGDYILFGDTPDHENVPSMLFYKSDVLRLELAINEGVYAGGSFRAYPETALWKSEIALAAGSYSGGPELTSSVSVVGQVTPHVTMRTLAQIGTFLNLDMYPTYLSLTDFTGELLRIARSEVSVSVPIRNDVPAGSWRNVLHGTMGGNDYYRISAGGASNAGELEIATADDATEPIYVSQYSGAFTTLVRRAALLDVNGNTSFPGSLAVGGAISSGGTAVSLATHTHGVLYSYTGNQGGGFQAWNLDGNTVLNPTGGWHYGMRIAHGDADTYYNVTLAVSFFDDNLKIRRKTGGVDQPWQTFWHTGNLNPMNIRAYWTAVIDPGSVAAKEGATLGPYWAWGAQMGDFVLVSSSAGFGELTVTAYVVATDQILIRLWNGKNSTAIDLPSSTWRAYVLYDN